MKRSVSGCLIVLMCLSMLFGIAGGGVMGGIAGYYVASSRQPVSLTASCDQPAAAQTTTRPDNSCPGAGEASAVTEAVKRAEPAVVTIINTMQVQTRRGSSVAVAEGSGVIIDTQGHIVTNAHVVQGAQQLDVVFNDGTKVSAVLVGADSTHDIAVLQVDGGVPGSLPLGDSSALQLGETVVAIGSPLGSTYAGSVSVGVVSGLDRSVEGSGQTHLIQTDAAINNGNSGGPMLNLAGQVIGINTLVVRQSGSGDIVEGLGFAIPSNTVAGVVQQILAEGQ